MSLVVAATLCCVLSGDVRSVSGAPIASARVTVSAASARTETLTDALGKYQLTVRPGTYSITATATGYVAGAAIVSVSKDAAVAFSLEPVDSPLLRVIGSVSVDGRLVPSRSAVPSIDLSRADFERLGYDRVIDGLAEVPSVTFSRPDGGASSAPAVVSLRGPDPSETLIALDGQLLNDGNTGDTDLSQLPVAAFSNVNVTEGLGPADNEGSNTIGGAVDLVTLRPTRAPHYAFSLSAGSFGASEGWYNTTGTRGKFGYALALSNRQEHGYVDDTIPICVPGDNTTCVPTHVGSAISARAALANLTWSFSDRADVSLRAFLLGDTRDLSSTLNGLDGNPDPTNPNSTFGDFIGPGNAVFGQSLRAYQLRARAPLGSGSLRMEFSASNNSVDLTGNATGTGSTPYDISHHDRRGTLALAWGRSFDRSDFEAGGYTTRETLTEAGVEGTQAQNIASYFIRGAVRAGDRLRFSGGIYAARYTSFGSNLDGRIAASYDLNPSSVVRFSVGTGFRAPLLIERYIFPVSALPPPDANCVIVGQGNPNEKPEHATEYELGYAHEFGSQANLDISLYRTNLRDPIENFYPLDTVNPGCATTFFSFPVNVGSVVYQGGEIRYRARLPKAHLFVSAQYGINIAYPRNLGANVSNPTSGGNLVNDEQFLGIPQQVGSIGLDYDDRDWHAAIDATFRGKNNELHQPPFTLLAAGIGKRWGGVDLTLAGTNLLSSAAGAYTTFGGGVPYRGVVDTDSSGNPILGPLPTDRLVVEPAGVRLILTVRR